MHGGAFANKTVDMLMLFHESCQMNSPSASFQHEIDFAVCWPHSMGTCLFYFSVCLCSLFSLHCEPNSLEFTVNQTLFRWAAIESSETHISLVCGRQFSITSKRKTWYPSLAYSRAPINISARGSILNGRKHNFLSGIRSKTFPNERTTDMIDCHLWSHHRNLRQTSPASIWRISISQYVYRHKLSMQSDYYDWHFC